MFIDRGYRKFWINGTGIVKACNVIAEIVLGHKLPKGSLVHHVDLNRQNDENTNLVICENRKYHNLIHRRTRAFRESGNPNFRKCWICKQWDDPANMRLNSHKETYVHDSCTAGYQTQYRKAR